MPRLSFTPTQMNRDLPPSELNDETWTGGKNIVFRRGLPQRASKGVEIFGTPPSPPVFLLPSITFDANLWLYGADNGVTQSLRVTDGDTHQEITPSGFLDWPRETNALTGDIISGLPFINWQTQSAEWNRDFGLPAAMTVMANAPICQAMRGHANRLIAINLVDDLGVNFPNTDSTVAWSSLPDPAGTIPQVWLPAIDNSAGNAQLSGEGPLIDGRSLRSSFVVYSSSGAFIMDQVGGSFVFSIRKLSSTTGVLSRNCIAETPMGHLVLSGDDVYINDGTNFRSIVNDVIKVHLFSQLGDNWFNSQVVHYAARGEVWVMIPTGANIYPNLCFVFDLKNQTWGQRELPDIAYGETSPIPFPLTNAQDWAGQTASWATIIRVWNQAVESSRIEGLVLADPSQSDPRFISIDNVVNGDNAGLFLSHNVEKADMALGDADRIKTVKRVYPRYDTQFGQTTRIFVGVKDNINGNIRDLGEQISFNTRNDLKADLYRTGRYFTFRFESGTASTDWQLNGFDVEFEYGGKF